MMRPMVLTAYKQNGNPHVTQPMQLLSERGDLRVLFGGFDTQFIHHTRRQIFTFPTEAALYFCSTKLPYLAVIIGDKSGGLNLYCHVSTPCVFGQGEVRYIDLDLDVLCKVGEIPQVIDEDEYLSHRRQMCYPAPLMHLAEKGVQAILADINAAKFPFDGTMQRFLHAVLGAKGDELDFTGVLA